jgi:hypothetical protein
MAWRLRLLEETAEIAMQVQRAMRDDIIDEQRFHAGTLRNGYCDKLDPINLAAIGQAPKRRDPAVTLDRAARALRLTPDWRRWPGERRGRRTRPTTSPVMIDLEAGDEDPGPRMAGPDPATPRSPDRSGSSAGPGS